MGTQQRTPVYALLLCSEWSHEAREAVLGSLRGQVEHIVAADDSLPGVPVSVLVVTRPVIFATGAVSRICKIASQPDRTVTRLLVTGTALTSVSLWSGAWLAQHGVGLAQMAGCGLDFDRDRLPHDDPHVRAWVRADDLGVAQFDGNALGVRRWAWRTGLRLRLRDVVRPVRAVVGELRRRRALAQQRRTHGGLR